MEEQKSDQPGQSCQCGSKSNSQCMLKLIIGIVFVVLGALLVFACFRELMVLIKGCIGLVLILAGAVTIAISKE